MSTAKTNLTKRIVDALKPGETRWDGDVKGFGIRCQQTRKVYVLKYRFKNRQRWLTIGEHGSPWTVETARREAQRLWGEIRSGVDVANLRDTDRQQPLMRDLCVRFIEDYAKQHKKPRSIATDQNNIDNHVLPLLGHMRVNDVTRQDVEAFKDDVRTGHAAKLSRGASRKYRGGNILKGGKGAANRCLALMSKMFNVAEAWGWRDENTNPVRLVGKYPENRRQRFLTMAEIERLDAILDKAERDEAIDLYAVAAIRLLLYTGARLGEILSLQWDYVHFDRKLLLLPDSKTGERAIYLSDLALDLLRDLPRQPDNPHVIVGKLPGAPLNNLRKSWHKIREDAGLGELRIHDLRHSFASTAAANGASLLMIGKLLGHTQAQTTSRYAHLVADPVKEAAQDVGRAMAGAFNSRDLS